jgi:hypothetical protein
MTRDTVAMETPAALATWRMEAIGRRLEKRAAEGLSGSSGNSYIRIIVDGSGVARAKAKSAETYAIAGNKSYPLVKGVTGAFRRSSKKPKEIIDILGREG